MTNRTRGRLAVLVLAAAVCGCDNATTLPAAPSSSISTSPIPPPLPGTLFMKGTVSDTAFRHLPGAVVEVLDGPQAGLSTTSDARGEFSFTGVFDDATRFRATKEGHVTAIRTLGAFCAPCNPNRWVHFAMEVLDTSISIAGDYTMTFVADGRCTMLPEDMRSRTFRATISQAQSTTWANPYSTVRVGGATFFKGWDIVEMGVAGDYVAFWLETLVEQIAPTTFLAFAGQAAASIGRSDLSTIVLPFTGSIEYCVIGSEQDEFPACFQNRTLARARCDSNNHQLILTRRDISGFR